MKKDPYEKLYKKAGRNTQSVIYTPRDTMPLQIAPQEYEEYKKAIDESEWGKQQAPMLEPKPEEQPLEFKPAPKFEVQKPETPIAEPLKPVEPVKISTPPPDHPIEKANELLKTHEVEKAPKEVSIDEKIKELTPELENIFEETEDIFSVDNIDEKFDMENEDLDTRINNEDEGLFEDWFEEDEEYDEFDLPELNLDNSNTNSALLAKEEKMLSPTQISPPPAKGHIEAQETRNNNSKETHYPITPNNDIILQKPDINKDLTIEPELKNLSKEERRKMKLEKDAKEAARVLYDAEKRKQANLKKLEKEKAILKATADRLPEGKDKTMLETAYGNIEVSNDPNENKIKLRQIKTYNKAYKRFNEGKTIDPIKKVLRLLLIIILLGIAAFSAFKLYLIFSEYSESNEANDATVKLVDQSEFDGIIDFNKLREINDDVVAWIYLKDSAINYPVVQCDNNSLYLSQRFDGTWGGCGTLFVDSGVVNPFYDMNTIIYGHHMKDGSMFNNLKKYKSYDYLETHPRFELITPDTKYHLDVVSFLQIDAYDDIYRFPLSNVDSGTRNDYLKLLQSKFSYSTDVSYSANDAFVSLSTCAYETDDARYVVLGKLVPWSQEEVDNALELHKKKLLDKARRVAKDNNH